MVVVGKEGQCGFGRRKEMTWVLPHQTWEISRSHYHQSQGIVTATVGTRSCYQTTELGSQLQSQPGHTESESIGVGVSSQKSHNQTSGAGYQSQSPSGSHRVRVRIDQSWVASQRSHKGISQGIEHSPIRGHTGSKLESIRVGDSSQKSQNQRTESGYQSRSRSGHIGSESESIRVGVSSQRSHKGIGQGIRVVVSVTVTVVQLIPPLPMASPLQIIPSLHVAWFLQIIPPLPMAWHLQLIPPLPMA